MDFIGTMDSRASNHSDIVVRRTEKGSKKGAKIEWLPFLFSLSVWKLRRYSFVDDSDKYDEGIRNYAITLITEINRMNLLDNFV